MREAEEEERAEKRLKESGAAPQLTELSDEQLLEELRRRAQTKQG